MIKSTDIFRLVDAPASIRPDDITALEEVVSTFPYYGTAHLLLAAATNLHDHHAYQRVLKRTAIHVPNRSRLFNLVEFLKIQPVSEQAPSSETGANTAPLSKPESIAETSVAESTTIERSENTSKIEPPATAEQATLEIDKSKSVTDVTEQIEVELGRSLLNAIVEKEVLKTPELHQPPLSRPESFGDWLAFMKKNNGQTYREIEEKVNEVKARKASQPVSTNSPAQPIIVEKRKKNLEIMDKIIANNPGPIRVKEEKFFTPETKAKESLLENEHLVTETLARIYALQGTTSKAIRAYEILSLKYPQKSAYFASLILKLRQNE